MKVTRRRKAKSPLQKKMLWCGKKKVAAADDLGDALQRIVDDHREMVGMVPIGPFHHEIANVFPPRGLLKAKKTVFKTQKPALTHPKSLGELGGERVCPAPGTSAWVNNLALRIPRPVFQLFAGAATRIQGALGPQLRKCLFVHIFSLALHNNIAVPTKLMGLQ